MFNETQRRIYAAHTLRGKLPDDQGSAEITFLQISHIHIFITNIYFSDE